MLGRETRNPLNGQIFQTQPTQNCLNFISHLEDADCDICLIQETFLKSTDTGKLQEIRENGWDIFSCPRGDRGGGGIGILFRVFIVFRTHSKFGFQTVWASFCTRFLSVEQIFTHTLVTQFPLHCWHAKT
eukprot:sb/3475138/